MEYFTKGQPFVLLYLGSDKTLEKSLPLLTGNFKY